MGSFFLTSFTTINTPQGFNDKRSAGLLAEWDFLGKSSATDARTAVPSTNSWCSNGDDDASDASDVSDAGLVQSGRIRYDYAEGVEAWVRAELDMPPAPWDKISEAGSDSSNAMTVYSSEDEDEDEGAEMPDTMSEVSGVVDEEHE